MRKILLRFTRSLLSWQNMSVLKMKLHSPSASFLKISSQDVLRCLLHCVKAKSLEWLCIMPDTALGRGVTWYLEDLVLTEMWRGRGVGRALFDEVVSVAQCRGAQRLEWQVLDWNVSAIGFYKAFNASLSSEWLNGRLTRDQLNDWAFGNSEQKFRES